MYVVKVLKRKDGAALVVGISVGLVVSQFITVITQDLTTRVTNMGITGPIGQGWRSAYFMPIVTAVLQLLALEILIRVYVAVHNALSNK